MRARIVVVLGLAALVFGALPATAREAPRLSSIAAAERDIAPGTRACFSGAESGVTKALACHYGRKGPRLLVIGDSHMRALSPAFRRLADAGTIRVTLVARSRCGWSSRPIKNLKAWVREDCQAWRANVTRYIRRQKDVRAIVTTHRASTMPGTRAQRGPDTLRSWRVALNRRIPVVAISDSANFVLSRPSPTQCLRRNSAPRTWRKCSADVGEVMWFDWTVPSVKLARKRYGPRSAFRISMKEAYCPERRCRVVTPRGQIMYRDHQHLTATYTRSLAPLMERRLRSIGILP